MIPSALGRETSGQPSVPACRATDSNGRLGFGARLAGGDTDLEVITLCSLKETRHDTFDAVQQRLGLHQDVHGHAADIVAASQIVHGTTITRWIKAARLADALRGDDRLTAFGYLGEPLLLPEPRLAIGLAFLPAVFVQLVIHPLAPLTER